MLLFWSDMVMILFMDLIGLLEIHGHLVGEKVVTSELKELELENYVELINHLKMEVVVMEDQNRLLFVECVVFYLITPILYHQYLKRNSYKNDIYIYIF